MLIHNLWGAGKTGNKLSNFDKDVKILLTVLHIFGMIPIIGIIPQIIALIIWIINC